MADPSAVLHDRHGDGEPVAARVGAGVPPVADDGVAEVHEKAVTRIGSLGRVVDVAAAVECVPAQRAPVVDVDEQPAVAAGRYRSASG